MEIYLIRHTTPDVPPHTCYGQTDVPLTQKGRDEIALVKQKLPSALEQVYSSPLSRCFDLAKNLSTNHLEMDSRLMELNNGLWEMKKWDDIDSSHLTLWMDDFVNVRTPEGESYHDLYERVTHFWDEMIQKEHETVAIVCHGGPIRAILSYLLEIPLKNSFRFNIRPGGVTHISYSTENQNIKIIEFDR